LVLRQLTDDGRISALDENVSDCRDKTLALRNRTQVSLAFLFGDLDKVAIGQLWRLRQDRTGDADFIVARQSTDNAAWRIADRCEPVAKLGKCVGLNLMDEVSEHVIKYADLLVIEVFRVTEKKVGYPPENFGATIARARGEDVLELFNDGGSLRHSCLGRDFFPPPSNERLGRPQTDAGTLSVARKAKVKLAKPQKDSD
jgi:hypothetical protein